MENNQEYTSLGNQAKKGLSTFILTLSISLIVFSTIYYFMTSTSDSDYEDSSVPSIISNVNSGDPVQKIDESPEVAGDSTERSVFEEIANVNPNTKSRQVLAGADETVPTTTTVRETTTSDPNLNTGITSITFGLFFALFLFLYSIIFVYKNPRKLALNSFEKRTSKGL